MPQSADKTELVEQAQGISSGDMKTGKPLVSLVLPAFNEEAIISSSLDVLSEYMASLEDRFRWEAIIVNDGSSDRTAELADAYAAKSEHVRVVHHQINRNLGQALQTGFRHSRGDYIVVLDMDLSYAPVHIDRLLTEMESMEADIVVASPYMKGGKVTKVPLLRNLLSRGVNYFMSIMSGSDIHTFTGMVRAYRRDFLENLNLKSSTYSINPEIIYKAILLRARIFEIPAHLDWSDQVEKGLARSSSIRIFKGILLGLMQGFIFRPYLLFIALGALILMVSLYMLTWIFVDTMVLFPSMELGPGIFDDRFSGALSEVFRERPYAFVVGGITLVVALQFLSIGFLSLQNKRYFDELFHLGTSVLKRNGRKH